MIISRFNRSKKKAIIIENVPSQMGTLTYNTSSQSPTWSNYNSTQLTIGGTTSSTNAGTYTATFTPKEGYQWWDGTTIAKSATWSIGKADNTLTLSKYSVSLTGSTTSDEITISNSIGTVTATSNNTSIATVSRVLQILTITGINNGNTTITVTDSGDNNYNMVSKTINVAVQLPSWAEVTDYHNPDEPISLPTTMYYPAVYSGLHPAETHFGEEIFMYQHYNLYLWNYALSSGHWDLVSNNTRIDMGGDGYRGVAIENFQNHPHLICGNKHIKVTYSSTSSYFGYTFEDDVAPPYTFRNGAAVVYNNKLHIIGGLGSNSSWTTYHYSFDGTTWTQESTLLNALYDPKAVVWNNEIHVVDKNGFHQVWDGNSWTRQYPVPALFNGDIVVYNNEIHVLGVESATNSNNYNRHYYWYPKLSAWYKKADLPFNFNDGKATVCNGTLYILGPRNSNKHYKYLK